MMSRAVWIEPKEGTAGEAVRAIADELALFDDWMERYEYIIELGRQMPPFPDEWKSESNRVPGCQSQVWLQVDERDGHLFFAGASDALIVSGLVALLLRVYSGRSGFEIQQTGSSFLHELGLVKALSSNRGNGIEAIARAILARARL